MTSILNSFDDTIEKIVSDFDFIVLESEEKLYDPLIFEGILKCPEKLASIVKEEVLKLIEKNDFENIVKINIFEALNDHYCKELDNEIYNILKELFKNYEDAYFELKIGETEDHFIFSEECGMFQMPEIFKKSILSTMQESHLNIPKIENLSVDNILIKKFCEDYNKYRKNFINEFKKRKYVIEAFRNTVLNSCDKNFGRIIIFPKNCGDDLDHITLDEAIKHECQHLCIFLMSVAKTCIWFGIHFSNGLDKDLKNPLKTFYELNESEFINLFSTYSSVLKRIYENIDEPKNKNEFIHELLDLCLNKKNSDSKYAKALESSRLFIPLKNFYKKIYEDSAFKKYETVFKNKTAEKIKGSKFLNKSKFNKLMKWTLKEFNS